MPAEGGVGDSASGRIIRPFKPGGRGREGNGDGTTGYDRTTGRALTLRSRAESYFPDSDGSRQQANDLYCRVCELHSIRSWRLKIARPSWSYMAMRTACLAIAAPSSPGLVPCCASSGRAFSQSWAAWLHEISRLGKSLRGSGLYMPDSLRCLLSLPRQRCVLRTGLPVL